MAEEPFLSTLLYSSSLVSYSDTLSTLLCSSSLVSYSDTLRRASKVSVSLNNIITTESCLRRSHSGTLRRILARYSAVIML